MSISFFPVGIPVSSSLAISSSVTAKTNPATFPTTASLAEYVTTYIGPTGPTYETVNVLRLI